EARTVEAFCGHIAGELPANFPMDPATAARGVFEVVFRELDPGEAAKVIDQLPLPLRSLWPALARRGEPQGSRTETSCLNRVVGGGLCLMQRIQSCRRQALSCQGRRHLGGALIMVNRYPASSRKTPFPLSQSVLAQRFHGTRLVALDTLFLNKA